PIHWAVIGGNMDILKMAIEAGVNPLGPSDRRFTTLPLAAFLRSSSITDLLIDAPIGDREHIQATIGLGDYPLHFAAVYAREAKVWENARYKTLEGLGAGLVDSLGETPLHRAAAMGNFTAAHYLVRHVALNPWVRDQDYVNQADLCGRTALWHAACRGSRLIVECLLEAGASSCLADDAGLAPVHVA
ncbi:ankyrin repeat-containing domain protein, partial [Lasiosphaeris hirsuta]